MAKRYVRENFFPDIFDDALVETPIRPNTMPQSTVDALAIMLSKLFETKALERRLKHLKGQLERERRQDEARDHRP